MSPADARTRSIELKEALLAEFDVEMRFTRKMLERVPEDKFAWKPHETSMTMGWQATFLAILPTWAVFTIEQESYDVMPPGSAPPSRTEARSSRELLELFERNLATARRALAAATEEHLEKPWTLKAGGRTLFMQPRWLVLRTYVLNHVVHHRAQLGVYLRMNGVPIPAIYSGSGDEQGGMFMENVPVGGTV